MPIECLISFDNNTQGVYYAGQELSGIVDLTVDTTKRIKAIHITVNGYAKIRWIKKGYPRDNERSMCRAYRSYLSSRSYVLGSCGSTTYMDWLAGEYSYTFHVILPDNLPTSFDGKYGQIHYEIITTIDRPGRYPKVFKLPFTVIHPLDLNADAIYKVPLDILDRKRFWSFCCPTGPLTVKFSAPYCGYAPGQKIHFVLYINNESSIDITECDVKLKQEVSYESHDPQHEYRYDKHLIACKQFGNVLRWSRKVYRGYLELPSIPPTSVKTTCPITVNYAIKIIIKPTEFHWKLKLKVPVTIGSVPIMDIGGGGGGVGGGGGGGGGVGSISENGSGNRGALVSSNNNSIIRGPLDDSPPPPLTTVVDENGILVNEEEQDPNQNSPVIIVTDTTDNPPDYIAMMPPSYEDAMALSDKFYDDTEIMENVSMSSVATNSKTENFKPRYPVYYEYETPIIPPETLYDAIPTRYHQQHHHHSMVLPTTDMSSSSLELHHVKTFKKFQLLRYIKK